MRASKNKQSAASSCAVLFMRDVESFAFSKQFVPCLPRRKKVGKRKKSDYQNYDRPSTSYEKIRPHLIFLTSIIEKRERKGIRLDTTLHRDVKLVTHWSPFCIVRYQSCQPPIRARTSKHRSSVAISCAITEYRSEGYENR